MHLANAFTVGVALLPCMCSTSALCKACTTMESPAVSAERRRRLGRLHVQKHRSTGSEERREHQREVHRQRVRLIRQQESNDKASVWLNGQLGNLIPVRSSAWNTMYALV